MASFFETLKRKKLRRFQTADRLSRLKILTILASIGFGGMIFALFGTVFVFAWFAKDLPRPDRVQRVEGLSTIIYDRNGISLYDIYENENRIPIKKEDIPEALKQATIAIEDKDFYKHPGLSVMGIARSFVKLLLTRDIQGGGSTLTQQLVKNVLLTNEQSLPRKIREAILAIQIERRYSKDEILQMYLNETPYGGPAVGVEAAAQYYFGKPAKELTFLESVFLAGVPQLPSVYNPLVSREPTAYIWRSEQVLRRMREDGYITTEAEAEAKAQLAAMKFGKPDKGIKAPHFIAYVRQQLVKQFGEDIVESGGLRVTTTLDYSFQEKAQAIVKEEVDKLKTLRVSNGAAFVLSPKTGEILAMIGSKDYHATESGGFQFNVVTQGLRQPGSTIKPIAYAAALQKGYTPATVLLDVETKYPSGEAGKPDYNPKNYDLKYRGPMSLRNALGNSTNTIAVKVTALVGIRDILRMAYDMGLVTLEPTAENLRRFGLSIALGGGEVHMIELADAFGVFANGGNRVEPFAISKVEDVNGKVLFERRPSQSQRVLSQEIAFLISHILSDNAARRDVFGERSLLAISGRTVAVKTGTTDDKRDNWTVGYTPSVVVAAWVGNNDNSPMHPSLASGVTGAAPIWNRIIREYLKDSKDEPFEKPNDIVEIEIDALTGGLPIEGQPTRKEFFMKGTEPKAVSPILQKVKVSLRDENKLANPIDIAKSEYREKQFYVFKEQDPVSTDGKNRWQEGIDAWIAGQSDPRFKVPTETADAADPITLVIKEPNSERLRIDSNRLKITAEATAQKDVRKMEIFVDGKLVKDKEGKFISEEIELENGQRRVMVKATDVDGRSAERNVRVGVNEEVKE